MGLRIIVLFLFIQATALGMERGRFTFYDEESKIATTVQQVDRTVLNLQISSLEYESESVNGIDQYRIYLPEEFGMSRGAFLGSDNALIPTITRTIAIPFDSAPVFRITRSDFVELTDVVVAPVGEEDLASYSGGDRNISLSLESDLVIAETAGIMRDIRIYSLTISPVQYDPESGILRVYNEIEIEIDHAGSRMLRYGNRISEAFLPIYRSFLDNILVFDPVEVTRGAYWILYADPFLEYVQPIADWKKRKGYHVEMIAKSDIGSYPSYVTIRDYIIDRFDTCLVKPDYITIIGDVTMPSNYGIPTRNYNNPYGFGDIESDNYYTFLEGDDYFPELLIGRISIDYTSELNNYIDKLFTYERTPYMDDTNWYLGGTMVAYYDPEWFKSPRTVNLWCRDLMMENGYIRVDTLFEYYGNYISPSQINASINNGVSFVNYRGYGSPSGWAGPYYSTYNINQLSNGPMYPVMTSIVCGTGDYEDWGDDVCFGEGWIRYANKGGAAFIGTSNHDTHTRFNNAIDFGIYWSLFAEGVTTITQAQLMGKMTMYYAFPGDAYPNGRVESYFNSYNVLGDPELNCWTSIPRPMVILHEDSVEFGQNHISVTVEDERGAGIDGAYVCLWKEADIFQGDFASADGTIDFVVDPESIGGLAVTVTARGFIPYEDSIYYFNNDVTVGYLSHVIDDDENGESSGDGNGIANPSEIIELPVTLRNFGQSQTAYGVTADLTSGSPYVEIVRGTADFSDMAPAESSPSEIPYLIQISPDAPNLTEMDLLLNISDNSGHSWDGIIRISIKAAELIVSEVTIGDGGDGRIDPGETFEIILSLINNGGHAISGATAILRTHDDQVTLIDSLAVFGDCAPGESFDNSSDTFMASVDSDIYVGHLINFSVEFTGSGPQVVTAAFNQTVGVVSSDDPIGPDGYGYYCFDNTDVAYSDHPVYDWINIDTQNWDYVMLSDDDVETIALPFEVSYYGELYAEISICDNGFVAMGESWWNNWYNAPIPAPQNAPAMVAPFWDDFKEYNLRVYYNHDLENSRFVIGWYNAYDDDVHRDQTFEIIILDRTAWPTATGDNEIIFQYALVNSPYSSSVGICSPDQCTGIEYLFNGNYADGAATLSNTRAIKFTTGSLYQTDIDEGRELPESFSLSQNYPNPFNVSTLIDFSIPGADYVKLEVFNILGQKIATLVDNHLEAGFHRIVWKADDMRSGVYFYRLETTNLTETKRMMLLK